MELEFNMIQYKKFRTRILVKKSFLLNLIQFKKSCMADVTKTSIELLFHSSRIPLEIPQVIRAHMTSYRYNQRLLLPYHVHLFILQKTSTNCDISTQYSSYINQINIKLLFATLLLYVHGLNFYEIRQNLGHIHNNVYWFCQLLIAKYYMIESDTIFKPMLSTESQCLNECVQVFSIVYFGVL